MAKSAKIRLFLTLFQLALVFFGTYLVLSLFEVWAFFPFWFKNVALITSLGVVYFLARRELKAYQQTASIPARAKVQYTFHALSLMVLVGFAFGFNHAGPGALGRIGQAITFSLNEPPKEVLLTLKVILPDYQNRDPVVVFSKNDGPLGRKMDREQMTFPEGSVVEIVIENAGNYSPFVSLGNALDKPGPEEKNFFKSQHLLQKDEVLDIQVGPYVSYRQAFNVTPDHSPTVQVLGKLGFSPRDSLKVSFAAQDDFGVQEVYLVLRKRSLIASEKNRIGLPLFEITDQGQENTHYVNLLGHPWAGAAVLGAITVVDGLGQETTSEEFPIILPERTFQNSISQRLISIRKALILTPERQNAQVRRLDVLTKNEAAFEGNKGIYLALRSAYWRLRSAETNPDLDEVTRFLWQAALALEADGSLEEQQVFDVLDQMTKALSSPNDLERFQELSYTLEDRVEQVFNMEFRLFSQRLSLESNIQRIDIPAFDVIRGLVSTMREEAQAGEVQETVEALVQFKSLFEKMAISTYSQAKN